MATEREGLLALLELHLCRDEAERSGLWRRGMASLALLGKSRPVPLEGLDPMALEESARHAIESGLADDMNWLSSAPRALFDLMISLPRGETKRELGRRVLRSLFSASAPAFAKLVGALAASSPRVLKNPAVRSRIALCLQMPAGLVPEVDELCLALLACPETRQTWLVHPSSGSLIERRLAARILERAAREVFRRKIGSNTSGLRVLDMPDVCQSWNMLLMDREPLVWRHAAAAVGVLVECRSRYAKLLETGFSRGASDGARRRSLCILAASIAVRGQSSLSRCIELLKEASLENRNEPLHTMLFGIETAASFECALADVLLSRLAEVCHLDHGAEVIDVRGQQLAPELGREAVSTIKKRAKARLGDDDTYCAAQASWLLQEADNLIQPNGVERHLNAALLSYTKDGTHGLRKSVEKALVAVHAEVENLGNHRSQNSQEQRIQYRAIRRIERHLLKRSSLSCLVEISDLARDELGTGNLETLRSGLHTWLLEYHSAQGNGQEHSGLAWRRSYMQSLIRFVDADSVGTEEREMPRQRRADVFHMILRCLDDEVPPSLQRMFVVCLARSCDAALRESSCEVSDIILGIIPCLEKVKDRDAFAEASLISPLGAMVSAYSRLLEPGEASVRDVAGSLRTLLDEIPCESSPRVEALRCALQLLYKSLNAGLGGQSESTSQHDRTDASVIALAEACQWLAQLSSGARRRLELGDAHSAPVLGTAIRQLDFALPAEELTAPLDGCYALADDELPQGFAMLVRRVLSPLGVAQAQDTASSRSRTETPRGKRESVVPVQATVAGYCILSNLGVGGASSVDLVCREEHRRDEARPLFALKRPRFSGEHAQVLSEKMFIEMFRREAETLLALPAHKNLAAFVTFDLGATPDPVLVMEYIEGPHLGRLMETKDLSCRQVLSLLDGIAAGLEAMHAIEIGHLDLKPENIIVSEDDAVLVDFGLAGREYRPGCGTLHYSAPELLVGEQRGPALPADVYSFACLVYELFCRKTLFDGDSSGEIVRSHLSHDGTPKALVELSKSNRELLGFTRLLGSALRQDPLSRATIGGLRGRLRTLAPQLEAQPWPLGT